MDRFDVKSFREKYGLNQIQLAAKLGLTERSVRRWEIEKVNPSPNAIRQLERVRKEIEKTQRTHDLQQQAARSTDAQTDLGPRRRTPQLPVYDGRDRDDRSTNDDPVPVAAVLPSFGR